MRHPPIYSCQTEHTYLLSFFPHLVLFSREKRADTPVGELVTTYLASKHRGKARHICLRDFGKARGHRGEERDGS